METEEIELIKRAQSGDNMAFDALIRLHDRSVLQIAFGMLSNLHDAQDVYQDTFIRAHRSIATYRFEASFKTWVCRIAVNLSINKRNQRKRRRWFTVDTNSKEELSLGVTGFIADDSTDRSTLNNELNENIKASLELLSTKQKAVFVLKHFHGYKISEIAELMECAEGTVKNYLFRATQKLRKKLKPFYI